MLSLVVSGLVIDNPTSKDFAAIVVFVSASTVAYFIEIAYKNVAESLH
jgi:hypothetical protein